MLGARPLEPGGAPVNMPDLQFADQAGAVALSRENLAPGMNAGGLPKPVRLIAPDAAAEGYLQFAPPAVAGDRLTLTLQVRAAPPGGGQALPISALSLHFVRSGDQWTLAEPPAALSP